jgi:hypothetical protein
VTGGKNLIYNSNGVLKDIVADDTNLTITDHGTSIGFKPAYLPLLVGIVQTTVTVTGGQSIDLGTVGNGITCNYFGTSFYFGTLGSLSPFASAAGTLSYWTLSSMTSGTIVPKGTPVYSIVSPTMPNPTMILPTIYIATPAVKVYPVLFSCPATYSGWVFTSRMKSGTCSYTVNKNGTAATSSVSASATVNTASISGGTATADLIELNITAVSSPVDLVFQMTLTP